MQMNKSNFKKERYLTPDCDVLDIKPGGVFCQSGDPLLLFGAFGSAGAEVTDEFIYNL